jgi:hypothetical protein
MIMKRVLCALALALFSLFLVHAAFAAETKKAPAKAKASDVKYKKSTTMEFDGRSIDGNVVSPDSADVEGDKNIKFDPMLEGRKDFKREFKRSSGVSR